MSATRSGRPAQTARLCDVPAGRVTMDNANSKSTHTQTGSGARNWHARVPRPLAGQSGQTGWRHRPPNSLSLSVHVASSWSWPRISMKCGLHARRLAGSPARWLARPIAPPAALESARWCVIVSRPARVHQRAPFVLGAHERARSHSPPDSCKISLF